MPFDHAHEVAVLRPKRGDVVVVYADPSAEDAALFRFLTECRAYGAAAGLVPPATRVTLVAAADLQRRLDDWLRPFGFRAVPDGR